MAKKTIKNEEEKAEKKVTIQPIDVDQATEDRLVALYTLQSIDTAIDKIKIIRGELPQAIEDLEDELAGLQTRIDNFTQEAKEYERAITQRKNEIAEHSEMIKKYEQQQDNVRNNREYEAINKEIEFQKLEIQLCERKNKDAASKIMELEQHISAAQLLLNNRLADLEVKKNELDDIIKETEKDEERLESKSKEQEQYIDERYLKAYKRIRGAARNGLAVVKIYHEEEDAAKGYHGACGGCFSQIPPQRQTEIKMHKKVIVCEYCGRIIVDDAIAKKAAERLAE